MHWICSFLICILSLQIGFDWIIGAHCRTRRADSSQLHSKGLTISLTFFFLLSLVKELINHIWKNQVRSKNKIGRSLIVPVVSSSPFLAQETWPEGRVTWDRIGYQGQTAITLQMWEFTCKEKGKDCPEPFWISIFLSMLANRGSRTNDSVVIYILILQNILLSFQIVLTVFLILAT